MLWTASGWTALSLNGAVKSFWSPSLIIFWKPCTYLPLMVIKTLKLPMKFQMLKRKHAGQDKVVQQLWTPPRGLCELHINKPREAKISPRHYRNMSILRDRPTGQDRPSMTQSCRDHWLKQETLFRDNIFPVLCLFRSVASQKPLSREARNIL